MQATSAIIRRSAVAASVLSLVLFSACSVEDDEPTAAADAGDVDQAGAQAAIDEARAKPEFIAPGPEFDASGARGMTVASIPINGLPYVGELNAGLEEASEATGLTFNDCPNNGTVGEWVKCFDQAIAADVDAIILNGPPSPSQLQPQMAAAEKAGIPVIVNHVAMESEFPPGTLPETNNTGATGTQPGPFRRAAELMADYTVATDGGAVNALIITSNEVPASPGIVKMITNQLAERCSSCQTTELNVPINDWTTKLQDATRTALLKDPDINWVITIYDGMMMFAVPGIQAAQREGSVKVTGFNGQEFALNGIADGTVTSTMGENLEWVGWSTIDRTLRVLTGNYDPDAEVIQDTPLRVWDAENISEAGTPPKPTQGYGEEYKQDYLDLWGIGSS